MDANASCSSRSNEPVTVEEIAEKKRVAGERVNKFMAKLNKNSLADVIK